MSDVQAQLAAENAMLRQQLRDLRVERDDSVEWWRDQNLRLLDVIRRFGALLDKCEESLRLANNLLESWERGSNN